MKGERLGSLRPMRGSEMERSEGFVPNLAGWGFGAKCLQGMELSVGAGFGP